MGRGGGRGELQRGGSRVLKESLRMGPTESDDGGGRAYPLRISTLHLRGTETDV